MTRTKRVLAWVLLITVSAVVAFGLLLLKMEPHRPLEEDVIQEVIIPPDPPTHAASEPSRGDPTGMNSPGRVTAPTTGGGGAASIGPDRSQLRPAQVAWNTPEQMRVGETAPIELRATFDVVLGKDISSRITAPGSVKQESADLSPTVTATLVGPSGIDIHPSEAQKRHIREDKEAVWMWTLEAKAPGDFPIILTLVSEEDGEPIGLPFRRMIKVSAVPLNDAQGFLSKNWKDIYTVIVVPVFGVIVLWWKRRRSKSTSDGVRNDFPEDG